MNTFYIWVTAGIEPTTLVVLHAPDLLLEPLLFKPTGSYIHYCHAICHQSRTTGRHLNDLVCLFVCLFLKGLEEQEARLLRGVKFEVTDETPRVQMSPIPETEPLWRVESTRHLPGDPPHGQVMTETNSLFCQNTILSKVFGFTTSKHCPSQDGP